MFMPVVVGDDATDGVDILFDIYRATMIVRTIRSLRYDWKRKIKAHGAAGASSSS